MFGWVCEWCVGGCGVGGVCGWVCGWVGGCMLVGVCVHRSKFFYTLRLFEQIFPFGYKKILEYFWKNFLNFLIAFSTKLRIGTLYISETFIECYLVILISLRIDLRNIFGMSLPKFFFLELPF